MLLPEFTIRSLLILTAVCGAFFAVAALAVRGVDWAVGLTAPVIIIAGSLLLQMGSCALAMWLGRLRQPTVGDDISDPFASSAPSEQLLPPQEQEW